MTRSRGPRKNLIDEVFDKLTVVRCVGKVPGGYIWECKCVCGNVIQRRGCDLQDKRRHRQNCGCLETKDATYWREMKQRSRERNMLGGVYFILAAEVNRVKIGYSKDVRSRISNMQMNSPIELSLFAVMSGEREDESLVQAMFASERVKGEWYNFTKEIKNFAEAYDILSSPRYNKDVRKQIALDSLQKITA